MKTHRNMLHLHWRRFSVKAVLLTSRCSACSCYLGLVLHGTYRTVLYGDTAVGCGALLALTYYAGNAYAGSIHGTSTRPSIITTAGSTAYHTLRVL